MNSGKQHESYNFFMITYLLLNMIKNNLYIARILISLLLLTLAGCNTNPKETTPEESTLTGNIVDRLTKTQEKSGSLNLSLLTTDLSSGVNRIAFALIEENTNTVIKKAPINMRIYQLDLDRKKIPESEITVTPELVEIPRGYSHLHEDDTAHFHDSVSIGIYVSRPIIPTDGYWLIELDMDPNGSTVYINPLVIQIRENSLSPSIGSPAPHSEQVILSEASHISDIDTSSPPDPEMHNMTIKEAIENERPTVIIFASPGFCLSLTCGTTKLLIDEMYQKHKNVADFIHIEPYDLDKVRNNQGLVPMDIMYEWGLRSEPWIFLLDSYGNISAKFEGAITKEELENSFKLISP